MTLLSRLSTRLRYGGLARHPLLKDIHPSLRKSVAWRIAYSKVHNFTYFRVPKAANSTITKTLVAHMTRDFDNLTGDPMGIAAKKLLAHLPTPKEYQSSYSFTFVRDPAARVLSAYLDKMHHQKYQDAFAVHRKPGMDQPLSFTEFLEILRDHALFDDPHWAPQSSILPLEGRELDFVGRVENLDRDLEQVCTAIFGFFGSVMTREMSRTHASTHVANVVSNEDRTLIHKLYETDYDLFFTDSGPV